MAYVAVGMVLPGKAVVSENPNACLDKLEPGDNTKPPTYLPMICVP